MKSILSELRPALGATGVLAVITCGFYPLAVTGVAQTFFPAKAHGSLVRDAAGTVRGSSLVGQNFTSAGYFHSRPSAAGTGYDGVSSSGSNLGPTSKKLHDQIQQRVAAYRELNGLGADQAVPADAATASGSGLDPHISLANAELQAARVARARNLGVDLVKEQVALAVDRPDMGLLGEPGVNVVRLNLALDALTEKK